MKMTPIYKAARGQDCTIVLQGRIQPQSSAVDVAENLHK
jgi:hypothetical protein